MQSKVEGCLLLRDLFHCCRCVHGQWTLAEEEAFRQVIVDRYDTEGGPYFSTARLWDDGIIDPADTRRVVGLALGAAANAEAYPARKSAYGVFRM